MKSLLSLSRSAFGNIDALQDELLHTCFEQHEAYTNMLNFSKFLAVGKKGSGKTAIFRMILDSKQYDTFTEGYNLNDYPWHYHNLQARIGVPDSEKYIQSWLYLQLISISKILINVDQAIPFDEASAVSVDVLRDFIVDSYGSTKPELANIFSPLKKLKLTSLSVSGSFGGLEIGPSVEVIEMKDLPTIVQDINKTLLQAVLKSLHPDHKYYICFDELDIGFEPNEDYFNQIIGLLRAARILNLAAAEANKQISICIFLRDDIYDILRFEDKRKFTTNCVTRIEWDTDRTDNTLQSLMNKRFSTLLSDGDEHVDWNNVFDAKSINGKSTKYNYITDMTCLRPRDIIDYCNLILEFYKKRAGKGVNNYFENVDIVAARSVYSRNLLEEFDDEVHKHLPNYELYLDVIKKLGKNKFYFSEFEEIYKKYIDPTDFDAETCLINLYKFSIVGNYIIGGTRGGSQKTFKYKDARNQLDFDLPIIVHPGLVPTLGIREK